MGARIHTVMWRRQITQAQLAGALGIGQGAVSRKLRGRTAMTVSELLTIAQLLDVPVEQLLAVDDDLADVDDDDAAPALLVGGQ